MAVLMRLLMLSAFGALVCACALKESSIQSLDAQIDGHLDTSADRLLSGVSRRKYFPNGGSTLAASSANITSMDDDEDEDDEDDDDEGDYHSLTVAKDGSVAKTRMHVLAGTQKAPQNVSSKLSDTQTTPLLMSSLPARTMAGSAHPESAFGVIGSYIGSYLDGFHHVMNNFFENIDRQIEKNRALPLLEHGDTFF